MRLALTAILSLSLWACSEKEEEDTGSATDGGASDGGASDGGTADGGTADGGSSDGGSADGGAEGTDLAGVFTVSGGCADTFIWAANDASTWALWFRDDSEIALRAHAAGTTLTETYDMAMDYSLSPTVAVQQGTDLRVAFCNDVAEPYEVTEEWFMTKGLVTIAVTPTGEKTDWGEVPASATLTLEDAVFTTHGGDAVEVSSFTTTVNVGWLPG